MQCAANVVIEVQNILDANYFDNTLGQLGKLSIYRKEDLARSGQKEADELKARKEILSVSGFGSKD